MTGYDEPFAYDSGLPYDGFGGALGETPMQGLRFDVAFTTEPDVAEPAWVDLSERLHLPSGVTISRGRENEFDKPQTGRMTLALENIDGALTPDLASGTYYPNVVPQRRCRLTYRGLDTYGLANLLTAEDASLEGGTVGGWIATGGAAVANSSARASHGTKSLLITWPTSAPGQLVSLSVSGLVIGRTYTGRAMLWVPVGVPDMRLNVQGLATGSTATTKAAWAETLVEFTATATTHTLYVRPAAATTAAQQTWVDAIMLDEGPALSTFTTTPVDYYIIERFDGHVDEWPVEWPGGGETYSRSTVTATDLLGRIGGRQQLRSVVVETLALDSPGVHFPLGEASDSTTVASDAGDGSVLTLTQLGTGGELTFGQGTGVPTDGLGAPTWAGASLTNGKYLTGRVPTMGALGYANGAGVTLEAAIASTSVLGETAVTLSDRRGNQLRIGYNSAGEPFALFRPYNAATSYVTVHTSSGLNNGQTHTIGARVTGDGTQNQLDLWVDGALSSFTTFAVSMAAFDTLTIGGVPGDSAFFAGTISHVAAWGTPVDNARLTEHHDAMTTGFAGERSDQRIARVCTWIGLPAERQALDIGNSTSIGHIDTTGLDPLDYMRRIETTEAGLLFAGTDGRLTFLSRARSYMPLTAERVNAISNSTFEAGVSGWSGADGAAIFAADDIGYSGNSCRLDTNGAGESLRLDELIDATPGQTWTASLYALRNPADTSTAQVRIEYLDTSRASIAATSSATATLSDTEWQRLSVTATAPALTAYVRMRLVQMTAAALLTMYADSAMLEESATLQPFINGRRRFLSLPVHMLDPSARMAKNLLLVKNDVTGSRQGGATVRLFDQDSVDAYGPLTDDLELVTTSDEDVANAVAWRYNTSRAPLTRFTALDLDACTDPTYSPQILAAVDIGCRVQITGMPAQAPASTLEQAVQGYTESISDSTWSLSVNATPYAHLVALVLDDPTFGALDTYPLAY